MDTNSNNKIIALAGNPNVGKSTIFNGLTGMNQHTGNWPGKTVTNAQGIFTYKEDTFVMIDLPGTYSLTASSVEEEVARDFICSGKANVTVVVTDATCLERNLNLVLQVLKITKNVIVCVNLLDEAKKKKIKVDLTKLSQILGVPVIGTIARSNNSIKSLKEKIYELCHETNSSQSPEENTVETARSICSSPLTEKETEEIIYRAKEIYSQCVHTEKLNYNSFDRKIDRIVTSKLFGIPIMILLLGIIFWITIVGANYPSQLLSKFFAFIEVKLTVGAQFIGMPDFLQGVLILGVYKTLAWVVSVMLPPMAIFFPLFTLLEDFGYLPRVAFNMDTFFKKASAHGKQALTMCMGFIILQSIK